MWLWLGLVSAQVLLVLWLGSEHELARALELQEQLLSGAASQLARVVDAVEEGLSPEKIEHLGAFLREDPLFGVVIDESGGRHRCWPSGLSAVADQVDAMLPADRGWAFVEEGAWAERGVLALRVTRAGRQGVLLLELPRLLVSAYQPSAAGEALILWVTGSGEEPRFFFCEPRLNAAGGWACSLRRQALWGKGEFVADEGQVRLTEGTSVGKRVRLAGQSFTLGVFVPSQSLTRLSPAWLFLLVFWAFLVGTAVLVWRQWANMEAQRAAAQALLARQEAELSARIAEASWRLLLDGVKEPLLFLRDDLVVRANQAAARLLGFEQRADLIGRKFEELLAPEDRERVKKLLPATSLSLGAFTAHFLGPRGRRRTVEVNPWVMESGEESLTCLSLEDFTARERLEKVLRAVLSGVNVGVAFLEPKGTVAWCNPALATALGVRPEELQEASLLPFVVPASRREVKRAFVRAIRGESASVVASCRCKGDVISSVELVFRSINVAGSLAGVVVVAQRAGLLPGQTLSEEVLTPMHELVAHALHRMANVVQASLAKGSAGKGGAAGLRNGMAQVAQEVQRLGVFFRLHGPGLVAVDLNQLVTGLEPEIRSLLPSGVRLVVRPWAGPAVVRGDGEQLALLVHGLVEASVECLHGGAGTVEVAVEQLAGGVCRLAVSDTGEVFSGQEELRSVLPARLRARALASCVARRHLGEAGFRERAGFGFRVWVDLPPVLSAVPVGEVEKPRPGKVLIVDDEAAIREGLAFLLRSEGYEALEASNGREALALYDADPQGIALVVLDLVMPEMDGREVYAELMRRKNPPRVLLATGYHPGNDPSLASALVLVKPFSADAFLEVVRRLVSPSSSQA